MTQTMAYRKRWVYDRHRGIDRSFIPAEPAAAHVDALCALGATCAAIAEVAGVDSATVRNLRQRRYQSTQRDVDAKVRAVTMDQLYARPSGYISRTGAVRRVQALLAIGWRYQDIRAAAGMRVDGVCTKNCLWVSPDVHAAIRRAYAALSMKPGPSQLTRNRSARAGYAPPFAWDDDTIDDPAAKPSGVLKPRRSTRAQLHLQDIEELATAGAPWSVTATRIGASRNSIERALARAERLDLAHRISRNSEGEYALAERRNGWPA